MFGIDFCDVRITEFESTSAILLKQLFTEGEGQISE